MWAKRGSEVKRGRGLAGGDLFSSQGVLTLVSTSRRGRASIRRGGKTKTTWTREMQGVASGQRLEQQSNAERCGINLRYLSNTERE